MKFLLCCLISLKNVSFCNVLGYLIGGAVFGYYYFLMRTPKNLRASERVKQNSPCELVSALNKGDVNTALELLGENADPNFTDQNQVSLLQTVVIAEDETFSKSDKCRLVSAMIRNGADVNYHGDIKSSGTYTSTALSLAVQNDDPKTAKILLDTGADPNIKDDNENFALDYANMLRNNSALKKSAVFSRLKSGSGSSSRQRKVLLQQEVCRRSYRHTRRECEATFTA